MARRKLARPKTARESRIWLLQTRGGDFPTFAVRVRMKKFGFQIFIFCPKFTFWTILSLKILILKTQLTSENLLRIIV